jgi:hypothetical protein
MLSFNAGNQKIAQIKGGKLDGKFIYMNNEENGKVMLSNDFFDKYPKLPKDDLSILKKSLKNNNPPKSKKIKKIYDDAKADLDKNMKRSIEIRDGVLVPIPLKKVVEKIYVSAPSGAGKSYWMGQWIREYKKMWKDDPVYLLSSVQSDEALDKYDPERISKQEVMSMDFVDEDFAESLVVFDDTFSIGDKTIRAKINYMIDAMLETGRHYDTRLLISSHLFSTPYTRRILCEATSVVFFPHSGGGKYHIEMFLQKYAGMTKQQISKIMSLKSRWVLFQRWAPCYIMYEKGIYML